MARRRSAHLHALLTLAAVGLAGCWSDRAEREVNPEARSGELSRGNEPPAAAPTLSASATPPEDDCTQHRPPRPFGPPAPSARTLSAEARSRVDAIQVFAHGSAVIVRKVKEGWVMGGGGCSVSPQRVKRALDSLSALEVVTSDEPPQRHDRQIILLDGEDVLLHYDVGSTSGGADAARLPDGAVVTLSSVDRDLLSAQPNDWCQPR